MKKIRLTAIVLLFAVIASLLVACDDTKNNQGNTDNDFNSNNDLKNAVISLKADEVKVGEEFFVDVVLDGIQKTWSSFEFALQYDTDLMQYVGVEKTDISKNMMDMTNPGYGKGKIKVAFATAEELTAEGVILRVKFKALKAGSCEVELSEEYMCMYDPTVDKVVEIKVDVMNMTMHIS